MSAGDDRTTSVERREDQLSLFETRESSIKSPSVTTCRGSRSPQESNKECFVKLTDIAAGFKRKFDDIAEKKKKNQDGNGENKSAVHIVKRKKLNGPCVSGGGDDDDNNGDDDDNNDDVDMDRDEGVEEDLDEVDEEEVEEEDVNETGKAANVSGGGRSSKKRKRSSRPGATASMRRLINMEDRAPLCLLGETESNMFPKTVELMNHTVPVIYDSRVHLWFKADDFAKALGYKNYKSSVEKYVNPNFVLPYPNVLDLSRARYGDAFRLYSVNNKTAFINEAGAVQLLLRWLVSGHSQQQQQQQQKQIQQQTAVASNVGTAPIIGEQRVTESHGETATAVNTEKSVKSPVVKPQLSADWINYQLQPALLAFSNAAKYGKTAKDLRYEMPQY